MPVESGRDATGFFYRWGKSGKKYYFSIQRPGSIDEALWNAETQGRAIKASQYRRGR